MTDQELFARLKARIENPKWLFHGGMGMKIVEIHKGYCEAEVLLEEKHGNPIGTIHGGLYLSLADNIGGIASATFGTSVTTISSHLEFLTAAHPETKKLIGKATVIKEGHRICVVEIRLYDDTDRLLATALYEYMKLRPYSELF